MSTTTNSNMTKSLIFGALVVSGLVSGKLIDSKNYGPLEGTVAGLVIASVVISYVDANSLPATTGATT